MYKTNGDVVLGTTDECLKQPVSQRQRPDGWQPRSGCPARGEGWECFLSAVLVTMAWAGGGCWVLTFPRLPLENVIRENQWGGVDIRRGGVPVLRSNLICFGYSDGVVVGDEGRGLIEGNTIYGEEHVPGQWSTAAHLGGRKPSFQRQPGGSEKAVSSSRPQRHPV